MATEITIPNLGYSMTKGKILKWLKAEGEPVQSGEVVLEIETDKVAYGIEASCVGILRSILASAGVEVPVGGIVGIIGTAEEEIDAAKYRMASKPEATTATAASEIAPKADSIPSVATGGTAFASPVAKKFAREQQLNLSLVKGSGRSGRIRLADVERYLSDMEKVKPGTEKRLATISTDGIEIAEVIPMNAMRKTIARRLSQSFHDAPHFNLQTEMDMTEARRLLTLHQQKTETRKEIKLSINDLFIKAVAVILCDHPRLNARLKDDNIEVLKSINIGLAVALDDGLIVPAIERADQKKLWQIAAERQHLVERAREGRLTLEEIERGTFTISNLGMYDIVLFNSILNPPQSGILSVGRITDRPIVREGQVMVRPIVHITLTVDHRIVDGAVGARFLHDLKGAIENPYLLF